MTIGKTFGTFPLVYIEHMQFINDRYQAVDLK